MKRKLQKLIRQQQNLIFLCSVLSIATIALTQLFFSERTVITAMLLMPLISFPCGWLIGLYDAAKNG